MKKGDNPGYYFLDAILRAYAAEKQSGKEVTASSIWDRICIECMRGPRGSFEMLFGWDSSKAKSINRIGTIRDVIAAGHVPGLQIALNAKGREIVAEC